MYKLISKNHNLFLTLAKTGISLAAVYYLWLHRGHWQSMSENSRFFSWKLISILLVFSLLNWLFEIKKWQVLVKPVKKINFKEAGKQSLISFSISLLTPNRLGDYGAKALFYDKKELKNIVSLNFIAQTSQLVITILMGIPGIIILYFSSKNIKIDDNWLKISVFLVFFGVIFYFLIKTYKKRLSSKKMILSTHLWRTGLLFASVRYVIFSSQFLLLLLFFKVPMNFSMLFPAIFTTYFFASLIPMLAFMDWAVKGSVAVSIFSLFQVPKVIIIKTVGLMWLSNFLLAFIVGLFLMWLTKRLK